MELVKLKFSQDDMIKEKNTEDLSNNDFIEQNELITILKEKSKSHRIYMKDISYFQSDSYLSIVHFITKKEPIIVSKLLKEFEKELSKYGFIRISRSILVNIKNVTIIYNNNSRIIIMKNGEDLTISCRNYKKVSQILKK